MGPALVPSRVFSVESVSVAGAVGWDLWSSVVFADSALWASSRSFCKSLALSASRVHSSSGPSSARSSSTVWSSSGLGSVVSPLQMAVERVGFWWAPRPLSLWKRAARSFSMVLAAESSSAVGFGLMCSLAGWSGITVYCGEGRLLSTHFDGCNVILDFFKALRRARRSLS